ncbi:MAG: hypothetical protein KA319_03420 [Ferruginibacter sp.]|nr:hypothetical protein [Ferruginibacter sp.]
MYKKTSILFCLLLLVKFSNAQPFTLDKNIKPIELRLIDYAGENGDTTWKGKVNFTTVTPKKDTTYFVVKGLSIYQPVYFATTGKNKNLEIKICKDNWKTPNQKGNLANGKWSVNFKTEGSFGIMMITKNREPYQMFTWAGKAIRAKDLPSPFKKQEAKVAQEKPKSSKTTKASKTTKSKKQ